MHTTTPSGIFSFAAPPTAGGPAWGATATTETFHYIRRRRPHGWVPGKPGRESHCFMWEEWAPIIHWRRSSGVVSRESKGRGHTYINKSKNENGGGWRLTRWRERRHATWYWWRKTWREIRPDWGRWSPCKHGHYSCHILRCLWEHGQMGRREARR